jgi:hypothetical protein
VTASTTAPDGSTVNDCVVFYVEGPAGGIPNGDITNEITSTSASYPNSYPNSPSYPSGGTQDLMAQVATYESSYEQFRNPGVGGAPDLFNLESQYGISAKWPVESPMTAQYASGSFIGLMQVPETNTDAWSWAIDAADGVSIFSGDPIGANKITIASGMETQIMNQYSGLNELSGSQLENMALVFYGGYGSTTDITKQYYTVLCSGKVRHNTCSTGWQWTVNTNGNPGGVNYANNVRTQQIPQ